MRFLKRTLSVSAQRATRSRPGAPRPAPARVPVRRERGGRDMDAIERSDDTPKRRTVLGVLVLVAVASGLVARL